MSKEFAIQFSMPMPWGTTSTAQAALPRDADEFFERIREATVAWRASAEGETPFLTIFVTTRRKAEGLVQILHTFCLRWNMDAVLARIRKFRFELSLGTNAESWIGCSNCDNAHDPNSIPREMRFRDYAAYLAELEAASSELEQQEKERRRASPVRSPIALPDDIATQIARYLRLEFGEDGRTRGSLKAKDLTFEGEFVVDGVPTQYWRFPVSKGSELMWATVERYQDGYALGMTGEGPPSVRGSGCDQ